MLGKAKQSLLSFAFLSLNRNFADMKFSWKKAVQIILPFALGGSMLYWMYQGFPLTEVSDVLLHEMKWEWMLLSFIPGILAQVLRALRWKQTLSPMGEHPRLSTCCEAIFLSYAASLILPRIGEVLRCGILGRHENTSFPKALGTVVTERAVDTLLVMLLVAIVTMMQFSVFSDFFNITGLNLGATLSRFTHTGIFFTGLCIVFMVGMAFLLFRRLAFMRKAKSMVMGLMEGVMSLKNINHLPLYLCYSIGIWVAYFFHYYLTFFCFDFTSSLGIMAGLVSFCVGTIAVIVPTPNGAGPWHFAVKTILVLYGLTEAEAITYTLIVHSIQTLLLVALGIYALVALSWKKSRNNIYTSSISQ